MAGLCENLKASDCLEILFIGQGPIGDDQRCAARFQRFTCAFEHGPGGFKVDGSTRMKGRVEENEVGCLVRKRFARIPPSNFTSRQDPEALRISLRAGDGPSVTVSQGGAGRWPTFQGR